MKRILLSMSCLVLVSFAIAAAHSQSPKSSGGNAVIQAVVHVNFEEAERQGHGLKNVSNILKEAPDSEIEVVCHGGGIKLVVEGESKHTEKVSELIGQGVRFVACENTLKERAIPRDKVLKGVNIVASGAVEVIRKQQVGFSYFKP